MKDYSDIINMPHHQSYKHKRMSIHDRAAQFAPFEALTGFEDDIQETSKEKTESFDELGRAVKNVSEFEEPC